MYKTKGHILLAGLLVLLALSSCSIKRQLKALHSGQLDTVTFNMPKRSASPNTISTKSIAQDTIIIKDAQGNEQFLMKAVQDDETGEMVATEVLEAATVTARFQNIAERRGKVDLEFLVTVPENLMNKDWQFRLYPSMVIQEDSTTLDAIFVTGEGYRERQLRGHERYENFVNKIVTDDNEFINTYQLNRFISRNIPELYAYRKDTSIVSREEFEATYGKREKELVEHYINKLERKIHNYR